MSHLDTAFPAELSIRLERGLALRTLLAHIHTLSIEQSYCCYTRRAIKC